MRDVPDFVVDKVQMFVLMKDKGLSKSAFRERFSSLHGAVVEFLSGIDAGFVSNNSEDFKSFLEERVGPIEFSKPFAVRIRPDSVRMFIGGKEIFK